MSSPPVAILKGLCERKEIEFTWRPTKRSKNRARKRGGSERFGCETLPRRKDRKRRMPSTYKLITCITDLQPGCESPAPFGAGRPLLVPNQPPTREQPVSSPRRRPQPTAHGVWPTVSACLVCPVTSPVLLPVSQIMATARTSLPSPQATSPKPSEGWRAREASVDGIGRSEFFPVFAALVVMAMW